MRQRLLSSIPVIPVVFSFQYLMERASSDTISSVPSCMINGINFEALANNSFIKLRTLKGAEYLVNRLQSGPCAPDWKLHFAIDEKDIPQAWDILACLFIEMRIESLMKSKMHKSDDWPAYMNGREITIYIPLSMEDLTQAKHNTRRDKCWIKLIQEAERRLLHRGVANKNIADGDLALGHYCSLRNEAFVSIGEGAVPGEDWQGYDAALSEENPGIAQRIYPPNAFGFNAANHPIPHFVRKFHKDIPPVVLENKVAAPSLEL